MCFKLWKAICGICWLMSGGASNWQTIIAEPYDAARADFEQDAG